MSAFRSSGAYSCDKFAYYRFHLNCETLGWRVSGEEYVSHTMNSFSPDS